MNHEILTKESQTAGEEHAAAAVHAVRLVQPRPADLAAVVGEGPLARSTVAVLLARGVCQVALLADSKISNVGVVGGGAQLFSRPTSAEDLDQVRSKLGGYGPDFVFACGSGPEVHRLAIDLVRPGGMIVLMTGDANPTTMNPNLFILADKRIQGSRYFTDADLRIARDLIRSGRLRLDSNVS